LYDEAQDILKEIVEQKKLIAKGVWGIFPARSEGDDIILEKDNETFKFFTLRQ